MLFRENIEKFDASYGIPRKANEQYLPAYQAFWAWTADLGRAFFFCVLGMLGGAASLFAGWLLGVSGLMWLVFWMMAILCLAAAVLDAYSLSWNYRIRQMSTSHGSARWARATDLIRVGLLARMKGQPIPKNALPLGKVFGGRVLFLPKEQWLRHFAMFGPTGSGKSKTFFIAMIRAVLRRSSCLVYDPKGELCEQTGHSARRVFRLDLNDPKRSDRWNFVPKCRNDPAFACQVAGMMLGVENRRKTNADPFWGDAEQIALTAILLHIAEVYRDKAIPAFAADFLLSLDEEDNDAFGNAMKASPSLYAKQAYLAFRQAPYQTRGSILIGLYNKLRPFTLTPARKVTTMPTAVEKGEGCSIIDFELLRKPGTAIYLVVSEGAADMYKELVSTFLGQAVMQMRLDGINEPKHPCFVLIDEAYQLNVAEVKRISGIGRGRGVGLGLGYQDLPQMYDQYGKEQANAILGTVMTKIFLPGLDDITAEYASKQLGDTTIFSKTYQDYPGTKNDNIRYAEQRRSLMTAAEIRQIAAFNEVLIVSDTAPPIRAAYPPLAVTSAKFVAPVYGNPRVVHLGDIDPAFQLNGASNGNLHLHDKPIPTRKLEEIVSQIVEDVLTDDLIHPIEDGVLTRDLGSHLSNPQQSISDALSSLTEDVRIKLQEQYERSLLQMNRSMI